MGYGSYGFLKPYTSKKGKNWYYNNSNSKYSTMDTHFDFTSDKTKLLEDIEEGEIIKYGLQPYAPIPISSRYSSDTKLYFAIEEPEILLESLIDIMDIPFIPQDRIVFNNITPTITGYDCYNNPIYNNIPLDVQRAILNTDSLTRAYLHNKIMAFCFEHVLPNNIAYDLSIYDNSIDDIINSKGFKDRIMLIRTDITNNRIIFLVSNIIENINCIDKYKECYDYKRTYNGSDILFTKRADTMYNILDNKLNNTYQEYKEGVKIFIGKNK